MTDTTADSHFNFDHHKNDNLPKDVEYVSVQPTVTSIREHAFKYCNSMKSIHIPNSVTLIGDEAFNNCTSLAAISIPNSVTRIGDSTFKNCTSLSAINIPNSVTEIKYKAFYNCTSLSAINIPNSVTEIGNCAFENCSSLTAINIPNSVIKIGGSAFENCTPLAAIYISNKMTRIGYLAFYKCDTLHRRLVNGHNYHTDTEAWLRQRFDNLPLHQAFYHSPNTMTTTLLSNIIQRHATMLTSTDAMLMTPLHVLCCNPTVNAEMIQTLKDACPDTASMRNVLDETPLMMYLTCKRKEYNSTYHVDRQKLSLVKLLKLGIERKFLEVIWILYNEAMLISQLEETNEISGLLPFMHGASLTNCGLDVVYELAMKRPDLLIQAEDSYIIITKERTKRKRSHST
jgi:hypothetical protein